MAAFRPGSGASTSCARVEATKLVWMRSVAVIGRADLMMAFTSQIAFVVGWQVGGDN
jgi:hypothetical protein